jgi:hypothetical protein
MTSDTPPDTRQDDAKYDPQDNPGTQTSIPTTEEGDTPVDERYRMTVNNPVLTLVPVVNLKLLELLPRLLVVQIKELTRVKKILENRAICDGDER